MASCASVLIAVKSSTPANYALEYAVNAETNMAFLNPSTQEAVIMVKLYDKRGIPFERGDVVKVYHFTGARRKRHYMYKQCLGVWDKHPDRMLFSHLNFIDNPSEKDGPYSEAMGDRLLVGYEIVDSLGCDHEERERKPAGRAAIGGEK
jgi:hypothetical protein